MTKKTYKVLATIKHDGDFYGPEDSLSLDDDPAALLIASGAIAAKAESKVVKTKAPAKPKAAPETAKPEADAQKPADK